MTIRATVLAIAVAAATATAGAAATARPKDQPYPVIRFEGKQRIYAPDTLQGPWGKCPRAPLPLHAADLEQARVAAMVALAVMSENASIDVTDAVSHAQLPSSTDIMPRLRCGKGVWRRTADVFVTFPRQTTSSAVPLSPTVLRISRVSDGWVVWSISR